MTKEEELKIFEKQLSGNIVEPTNTQPPNNFRPGDLRDGTTKVKKNLLLAYPSDTTGCGNIRCTFPINYMNSIYGKTGKFMGITSPVFIYQEDVLARAKTIFFQRQMTPDHLKVIKYYKHVQKRMKFKMVWDIDDFIFGHNETQGGTKDDGVPNYNFGSASITETIKKTSVEIMNLMDTCVFSTQFLADYAKNVLKVKTECVVLPNSVASHLWGDEKRKPKTEPIEKPKVLYTGSPTHYCNQRKLLGDFENAWKDWVIKSVKNDEIDFTCMGGLPWFFESIKDKIQVINWVNSYRYYNVVKAVSADFGIMPLVPNNFNRGKSDIKAIEHYADGTVCIGTTFSDGTQSPYDNNPLTLPDNCTVADIDAMFEKYKEPDMYNEVREKQYKLLMDGRLYESKEYIEKFMKIMF